MTGSFVIDASIALKWYLDDEEEHVSEAQHVLESLGSEQFHGFVPSHFFAEIASTLYRKKPEMASQWLAELLEVNVKILPLSPTQLSTSDRILKKYPSSIFYDVLYHALALDRGATLVTADKKYYEQTKKEGHIMLLKDFPKE